MSGAASTLNGYPALVLNADGRPLCYHPLSLCCWQGAVRAVVLSRVRVLANYARRVRSPSVTLALPSVIALKRYVRIARRPPLTRMNVFLRDGFVCQYCGRRKAGAELTRDHVIPRSRGGACGWNNVVTACSACNRRKGNRLPRECGLYPLTAARMPSPELLWRRCMARRPEALHRSWDMFLHELRIKERGEEATLVSATTYGIAAETP